MAWCEQTKCLGDQRSVTERIGDAFSGFHLPHMSDVVNPSRARDVVGPLIPAAPIIDSGRAAGSAEEIEETLAESFGEQHLEDAAREKHTPALDINPMRDLNTAIDSYHNVDRDVQRLVH